MNSLYEASIHCPYCGESIEVLIDCSVVEQEYIEDCQVCCKPITVKVQAGEDDTAPYVNVYDENES